MNITAIFIDTDFPPLPMIMDTRTTLSDVVDLLYEENGLSDPDLVEITFAGRILKKSDNLISSGVGDGDQLDIAFSKKGHAIRELQQNQKQISTEGLLNDIWKKCSVRTLELYIDAGVSVSESDLRKGPPIRYAAHCERVDIVKALLDYPDVDPNSCGISDCCPALIEAAISGNLEICQMLSSHPLTDTNIVYDGNTPLEITVRRGHLDCVKFFISLPECRPTDNLLLEAVNRGYLHIVEYLTTVSSVPCLPRCLLVATMLNYEQIAQIIIPLVDINTVLVCGTERKTSLHCAVEYDVSSIVRLLVSQPSINLKVENHDGDTAYDFAMKNEKYGLAEIIKNSSAGEVLKEN